MPHATRLRHGADDPGTIIESRHGSKPGFHMAGATSRRLQTEADVIKAIREAGRTPVQRNASYEVWRTATCLRQTKLTDIG